MQSKRFGLAEAARFFGAPYNEHVEFAPFSLWKGQSKTVQLGDGAFVVAHSSTLMPRETREWLFDQTQLNTHPLHTSFVPSNYHTPNIATMTIDNLTSGFNLIHLDESNRFKTTETPVKVLGNIKSLVVSPESTGPESYDFSVSSDASSTSSDEIAPFHREVASISEHKLDELAGRHAVEPLLKENPNRFVLFPIEDNEVSSMHLLSFIISKYYALNITHLRSALCC